MKLLHGDRTDVQGTVGAETSWAVPIGPDCERGTRPATVHLLNQGESGKTVFLVPGLEGSADEMALVSSALKGDHTVYVVTPPVSGGTDPQSDLRTIAQQIVLAIHDVSSQGPYHLGGYSYGGLLAFEAARYLRCLQEPVGSLILIDAVYDERYWPNVMWAEALIRRTARQLVRIASLGPSRAGHEFVHRTLRFVQRLQRRRHGAVDHLQAGDTMAAQHAYGLISRYQPSFYEGAVTFIGTSDHRHFGVDASRLWLGLVARLDVYRVPGDHLSVIQDTESATAIARLIDRRVATYQPAGPRVHPLDGFERPLLVTTMKWFSAARLSAALVEADYVVSACCPRSHPLTVVQGVERAYSMNRLGREKSVQRAIERARPDIILADDERALALLRRLHTRLLKSDPRTASLIARSLGTVTEWPTVGSRTALARTAREAGVLAPCTAVVEDEEDVRRWASEHGVPFMLKTDGSWGGRGVAVVKDSSDIAGVWGCIGRPPGVLRALKRLVFDLEVASLVACMVRNSPVVNAQSRISGREAIATVACSDGRVLGVVCMEVVEAMPNHGAATVVRIIENPAMVAAAAAIVRRFGLSGFCGLDFILNESSDAVLVELNARVTPTAYLLLEGDYRPLRTIALFPADVDCESIDPQDIDVPTYCAPLVELGQQVRWRRNRMQAMNWLQAKGEQWLSRGSRA